MNILTFRVPGMTCGHCEKAVTSEVMKITGVESVDIDLDAKTVTVTSDSALAWADVETAVDEAGFEAVAG
ncbi:MAG: heavy metal-associated domain-containing protein [Actinomycetota bacterium]|nr:heavy metal-associated domain-containing protein [Actinomycetota bacterium]MDA3012813.1 heavy metal-associated domain-containing protein [Actinomycetota bacterium]MDA3025716.1 heavy metal-associated domain-containing protein [Actinomycetota bacterium]